MFTVQDCIWNIKPVNKTVTRSLTNTLEECLEQFTFGTDKNIETDEEVFITIWFK